MIILRLILVLSLAVIAGLVLAWLFILPIILVDTMSWK